MRQVVKAKDLKVGDILHHGNIGLVQYTEACAKLQSTNPDPTSLFVDYRGVTIEVSIHLVSKAG